MAAAASPDRVYSLISTAFDVSFYKAINPDVAESEFDPVRHYVEEGWREGRDPATWFSNDGYLERHADVAGTNPFYHYLTEGWREGRDIAPSRFSMPHIWRASELGLSLAWTPAVGGPHQNPTGPALVPLASTDHSRALLEAEFDAVYYRATYPDLADYQGDLLDHFEAHGWREGRNPSATFSVDDYLELNPDVAAAKVNPFAHYLVAGRAEGRPPRSNLGFRHRTIARLSTLPTRLDRAETLASTVAPSPIADLEAALAKRRATDGSLHISFSHDDFTANLGGVQLCLQREAAALADDRVDHLHLCPVTPWPTLRPSDSEMPLGVIWNGQNLGAFAVPDVIASLQSFNAQIRLGRRSFALHSLLGHRVDEVIAVLQAAGMSKGFLWLHDFTSLCAGFHLMRNDVADCGAPPMDSAACRICVYGGHRQAHVSGYETLFDALDLTVVAPSQTTFETWRAATTAPPDQSFVIHPLARLVPARQAAAVGPAGPLKVAFLGMPAAHKGWFVFTELAERFSDDARYQFCHMASVPTGVPGVTFHNVSVTAKTPFEMGQTLADQAVDVALIWSLCRETFSFATHEAAASGTAILTGPDSGNVAAFVTETSLGWVLADEAALIVQFETGKVLELSRRVRRPAAFDLQHSAMTVDLLERR